MAGSSNQTTTLRRAVISFFVALAFGCTLLGAAAAAAQEERVAQSQPENLIYSLKGPELFQAYCATCHGSNGKGDGPVAPALKAKVPDLTLLAKKNGAQLPSARLRRIIAGDEVLASHGSREMPIWGPIFHQIEEDQDFGNVRLENLVKYLQSIQLVAASTPPYGADLYAQHCAVCHGNDLKGTGPVPYPYRTPPDLTTLARRHAGEFPNAYVSEVLRSGAIMPAHGPAEMPIWGTAFRVGDRADEAEVTERIAALAKYIQSRQIK